MDGKKEESVIRKTVKSAAAAFRKAIIGDEIEKAVSEIKGEVEDTLEHAKRRINAILDDMTGKILGILLVFTGIVFGFVGLAFFLQENTYLPSSSVYMIVGVIVLALGWMSLKKRF